ncbi:MAG: hypothetical protein A3G23_14380 [Bacteroidetes bacterium RIFCSPLOWO2_12_FULL_37_12]|nr:MAG: hypothetical protein A3G23_14380 [Bacteroidetes bacterium RIFCSPLOWO2_12_FULL_37_12]
MKKIINNLIEYSTQQFHFVFLICMAVFLSICISINYYFDFEHKVLDTITQSWLQVSSYFLFYALAYFPVFIGYCYFFNKQNLLKNYTFWLSSAVGILTLSINSSMHFQYWMAKFMVSADLTYWVAKCLRNLFSSLQIFTCLYLFWFFYDRKKEIFYGFTLKGFHFSPYLIMWFIMLPLIFWASFQPDFLAKYPTYKGSTAESFLGMNYLFTLGIYELFYGFDFTFIELLFRGFFVIGIARIIGPSAVFPMVSMYCFLHFGKPLGECVSSVFGGYILGVIALYSRNIFGGVCIHIGVAWTMELFAILQKH